MRQTLMYLLVASLCLMSSCGAKSELLGKWTMTSDADALGFSFLLFTKEIEFLEDGSFVVEVSSGEYSIIEDRKVKFSGPKGSDIYDFSIQENTLTLSKGETAAKYTRSYK